MFTLMKIRYFVLIGLLILVADVFIFGVSDEDWFSFGLSYTLLGFYPILWLGYQLKKQNRTFSAVIQPRDTLKKLPRLVYIVILVMFFSLGSFWLLNFGLSYTFPGVVDFLLQEDDLLPESGLLFMLMVLYVSILGPIAEEIIFRGLLLNRLSKKMNPIAGLIIANGLFGILHMDIIGAFIFGIMMSLLYFKTGNLWWSMMVHMLNNTFIMLMQLFHIPDPTFATYTNIAQVRELWLPNTLIFAVTAILVVMFIRKKVKEVHWGEIGMGLIK